MELEEQYQKAVEEFKANKFIAENISIGASKGGSNDDEIVVTDSYHTTSLNALESLKKKFDKLGDYQEAPLYSVRCQSAIEKYQEQYNEDHYKNGVEYFNKKEYAKCTRELVFITEYKDAKHYYDIGCREEAKIEAKLKRKEKRKARGESFVNFLKKVGTVLLFPFIGLFYAFKYLGIGIWLVFKYIGLGIKAAFLGVVAFFAEYGAGIGKVLLYIIGAPFIAIYFIGYGIVKLFSNDDFLSGLGVVLSVILVGINLILYAAPFASSVVFAVFLFGNVDGISIVSGFGWWCFLWVIYTIVSTIATIALFYWYFSSWVDDENWAAIYISAAFCLLVVGGASTLVGVNIAPVIRRGSPTSFVDIKATSKEGKVIHFSLDNGSDVDVNYILGDMWIYNGTNQVGYYHVYFQGDYYAGCSKTTYVDFTDASNSFINTPYSDLSVTYKITRMRFFDSYNEHKYSGPLVSLAGSYGVDDEKNNEYKEIIYLNALDLYKKGDYVSAYKEFKKILSYKEASTYYNLCKTEVDSVAKTLASEGDYEGAKELLESVGLGSESAYGGEYEYQQSLYYACKEASYGRYGPYATYFNLTELTIPDGVTVLEEYTLQNCYCVTKVIIPDSVTEIKGSAFLENSVETIVFGTGLTKINNGAFIRNSSLRTLDFSKCTSLQRIEKTAVYEGKVTKIYLPNSINFLGEKAFYYKGSGVGASIYYSGTKAQWDSISKTHPIHYCYNDDYYYYYCDSYTYEVYCSDATGTFKYDPYYGLEKATWEELS